MHTKGVERKYFKKGLRCIREGEGGGNESHNQKDWKYIICWVDEVTFLILIYVIRDEAEMEYLKIAQDLEMYGVSYFEIKVSL